MPGFWLRTLASALGLGAAAALIPGIVIADSLTLALAALLLGIVNAFVRPILLILTLPFTILTLGLFVLVINAMMLGLVAWLLDGFAIAGFGSALLGAVVVGLVSGLANLYIGPKGSVEVMVVRDRVGPG